MPIFKRQQADEEGFWATAVTVTSLQEAGMVKVKINGQQIIVAHYADGIHAFTAICPHAAADLSKGELHRYKLYCPDHEYCFDVRNGRLLWPEDEVYRLKQYSIKTVDGTIYIKL